MIIYKCDLYIHASCQMRKKSYLLFMNKCVFLELSWWNARVATCTCTGVVQHLHPWIHMYATFVSRWTLTTGYPIWMREYILAAIHSLFSHHLCLLPGFQICSRKKWRKHWELEYEAHKLHTFHECAEKIFAFINEKALEGTLPVPDLYWTGLDTDFYGMSLAGMYLEKTVLILHRDIVSKHTLICVLIHEMAHAALHHESYTGPSHGPVFQKKVRNMVSKLATSTVTNELQNLVGIRGPLDLKKLVKFIINAKKEYPHEGLWKNLQPAFSDSNIVKLLLKVIQYWIHCISIAASLRMLTCIPKKLEHWFSEVWQKQFLCYYLHDLCNNF